MKLLTKETDYAARALVYLAGAGSRFISSTEISREVSVPVQFLRRILVSLASTGIIVAKEGIGGGVKLVKDPKKIKLIELIRQFQGDFKIADCMFRKNICPNRLRCILRKKLVAIEKKFVDEIKDITLQDLMQ